MRSVTVINPGPDTRTSNEVAFTVTAANPVPSVSSLNPNSAVAGGPAFTLSVSGSGFVQGSMVQWNGSNRPTMFGGGASLSASIPASDIASAGSVSITVFNPGPGGGSSNSLPFTIVAPNNPAPVISGISPNSAIAGGPAFTLSVSGSGFVQGSMVQWNGSNRPTMVGSGASLSASIPASDIANAGSVSVTVFNPGPGGGSSNSLPFTVAPTNPTPVISGISPNSAIAGGPAFTLSVSGSGFVQGSMVQWNGSNRPTMFGSGASLSASIPASDIASAGSVSITVFNPGPGGGSSNSLPFTIVAPNNPAPVISGISPNSAIAGGPAFTLSVSGSGFVQGSIVQWNGSPRPTMVGSGASLSASIPASDIANAGSVSVTVFNPGPGGGSSNSLPFTVAPTNPTPVISGISPNSAIAGGPAFTLSVSGSGFVQGSMVQWNGSNRPTMFASGASLSASIPASDIASAGSVSVTVFNPGPGGGSSNSLPFTIVAPNPAPSIGSLEPSSIGAGSGGFTLTVNGSNFISGSVVRWNGADRSTSFGSSNRLTASIPASDIAAGGSAVVTVVNPGPGGGSSNEAVFTINNPAPELASINPTSAAAGGPAFTLTVNGSNFISGSVVRWNGSDRSTSGSGNQLTATIPASDIATGGTASITVFNPGPGGGASNAATFTVNNPTPVLASVNPTSATAGGPVFTLTVSGSNFVGGSVVRWNGSDRPTSGSGNQLTATIPASDIATGGTASITVFNPGPGGGASNAATFTINNAVPVLASINPSSATGGGPAFTLAVSGSNFVSGSVVRWDGSESADDFRK